MITLYYLTYIKPYKDILDRNIATNRLANAQNNILNVH